MNKLFSFLLITLFVNSSFAAQMRTDEEMLEEMNAIHEYLTHDIGMVIARNQIEDLRTVLSEKEFDINDYCIPSMIHTEKRENGSWKRERCNVTPLIYALLGSTPEIVKELVLTGADLNKGVEIDDKIYYPLRIAYSNDHGGRTGLDTLILYTKELVKGNLSSEHIAQALSYINEFIRPKFSEWANKLQEILENYPKMSQRL